MVETFIREIIVRPLVIFYLSYQVIFLSQWLSRKWVSARYSMLLYRYCTFALLKVLILYSNSIA